MPTTIILFGSYARGNWVKEKFEDDVPLHRYQSDCDVLVLIADRSMRNQRRLEENLVHDLDFVNAQLAKAQYFFSDIKREGILLYGPDLLLKKANLI